MTYVSDKLYKYIRNRQPDFLKINAVELLPHLPCLTQMDLETTNACARNDGNERAVPHLLDCCKRRKGWEMQLIQALEKKEYTDLASDLKQEFQSLTSGGSGITGSQWPPSGSPKANPSAPATSAHHSPFPSPPPTSSPANAPHSSASALPSPKASVPDFPSNPVEVDLSMSPTNPRSSSPTSTLRPSSPTSTPNSFSPAPVPSSIPRSSSSCPSPIAPCQGSAYASDLQASEGSSAPALKVSTAESAEPSEVSPSSDQLKIPIQEMGDMKSKPSLSRTDRETQKQPIQNIIIFNEQDPDSRPSQNPRIRATETEENLAPVKQQVAATLVASSEQSTVSSTVLVNCHVSSGAISEQSDENSFDESIQKPGVLLDITDQPDNWAPSTVLPCSIRLSELMISSSTFQASGSDGTAEVCSNADTCTSGASPADSDGSENSLKEQKLQALQGYQNNNLEHSFHDVHQPLLIQENFDAEKKLHKMGEGPVTDGEGVKIKSGSEFESELLSVQRSTTEAAQGISGLIGTQPDPEISDGKGAISTHSTMSLVSTDRGSEGVGQMIQASVRESDAPVMQVSWNGNPQGVLDQGLIANRRVASENTFNHTPATQHDGKACTIAPSNISYDLSGSSSVSHDGNSHIAGISKSGALLSNRNDGSKVHQVGQKGDESCDADIRVHTGHIHEGAFRNNEAGSDHRFAATHSVDLNTSNSGGGYVNSLSDVPQPIINTSGQNSAVLPSASQEWLTGKQPVESDEELPCSNSMMRSVTIVALVAVVIGCLWKYCRK
ncbi:mitochondrial antiviral-signaling protein isoform X1 [Callorhinchus milii]|uniref:mitochondrial antiviral-signaling protein isoform X1 n=1 Tax=Callorhinchus milii TaxID=7868 RepID=UPI001C3FB9A1|nr:mitochondrial antiviral-signaling protein isoform X1 [Callorhinchus milii]